MSPADRFNHVNLVHVKCEIPVDIPISGACRAPHHHEIVEVSAGDHSPILAMSHKLVLDAEE